jgi:hypothetical protein
VSTRRSGSTFSGQADAILAGLEQWISSGPGRRVTIELHEGRWRATLDEKRPVTGGNVRDALAQAAQVATCEVQP